MYWLQQQTVISHCLKDFDRESVQTQTNLHSNNNDLTSLLLHTAPSIVIMFTGHLQRSLQGTQDIEKS